MGPALAHRVVAAFGKDTMAVLEKDPQRLLEVEGIGPKKLAVITESFYEEKQVNDIAYDLEQHGVAGRYASRLLQKYGDDVHYVLTEEPYRMIAEIDGIGFKTADQIALAYGMDRQDPQRLSAGLTYVLRTMTQNGHVCIPDTELVLSSSRPMPWGCTTSSGKPSKWASSVRPILKGLCTSTRRKPMKKRNILPGASAKWGI